MCLDVSSDVEKDSNKEQVQRRGPKPQSFLFLSTLPISLLFLGPFWELGDAENYANIYTCVLQTASIDLESKKKVST